MIEDEDDASALVLGKWMQSLRRRIAPPNSIRERLFRTVYLPFFKRFLRRHQSASQMVDDTGSPFITIQSWDGGQKRLPDRAKILILKLDHIGDFLLGMRAFQHLRETFPTAHLTLVCASWNKEFALKTGWFDTIVVFDFFTPLNRDWTGAKPSVFDRLADLLLLPYDLAIDLRHDSDTRPCLNRITATYRAGFVAPSVDLDLALPHSEVLHAELRLQLLAETIGIVFGTSQQHPARRLLKGSEFTTQDYVILSMSAGDPIRQWSLDNCCAVVDNLKDRFHVYVFGGKSEQEICQAIARRFTSTNKVEALTDLPLAAVADFIANAKLLIGHGSGMTHLAGMLSTPTVCLLGGTTPPTVWHSVGDNVINITGQTLCSPCGLHYADDCPYNVVCLASITVKDVMTAVERVLERA